MPRFTPQAWGPSLLIGGSVTILTYTIFSFALYSTWHDLEQIAHHGQPAIGTVIEKQPMNHLGLRFEYSVGSTKYFGEASAGMNGLPRFEQINIGDTIRVTYYNERPSTSVAGDSSNAYKSISFLFFVLMPTGCLILGGLTVLGLRKGTTFSWIDLIRVLRSQKDRT